ncbi:hypothetical protein BBP40_005823 [Aspergillus hancockii]|nr:hypothetical protein BBP40_005823 [Aspergillus hancockii]
MFIEPEVHYDLLSKRGLVYSGLPTPKSFVIGTQLLPGQLNDTPLVDTGIQRMLRPVQEKDLSFVVKVPQSISGQVTFVLRTESDRQAAVDVLQDELREMLWELNLQNHHLDFAEITNKLARFLHGKGYYGPAGADIMIDRNGRALIINMNVRVTGSHHLGCLRGHFMQRGLMEATVLYPLYIQSSKAHFREHFRKEFENGSMIISSWTTKSPKTPSVATIAVAGADKGKLRKLIAKVNAFGSNVSDR